MINPDIGVSCIIVAAGSSTRMGGVNKQLLEISGKKLLEINIENLVQSPYIKEFIVVTSPELTREVNDICAKIIDVPYKMIIGGETRQQSVFLGIDAADSSLDLFAIHDGARPFASISHINSCFATAYQTGACALGVKVKDTIKVVNQHNIITSTPDRNTLYAIQTPQVFSTKLYIKAKKQAICKGKTYTDDCALIEAMGHPVTVGESSYSNIKITTPEDIGVATAIFDYKRGKNGL